MSLLVLIWELLCGSSLISASHFNDATLDKWWKPTDFGSPELQATSTYFDPYRNAKNIKLYYPYLNGYMGALTTASIEDSSSFEDCVKKCNDDEYCLAFEINMLYLPFRCRIYSNAQVHIEPCITSSCVGFTLSPFWKHFAKKQKGTISSTTSKVSLDFSPHYEYKPAIKSSTSFAIERVLTGDELNWQLIELDINVTLSSSIQYLWFEYWSDTKKRWHKCQKIPFQQKSVIHNQCIQFSFITEQECDVLKQSWDYWTPNTLSQQMGDVHLANTATAQTTAATTLKECEADLAPIEYKHIQSSKVRLLSLEGEFVINDITIRYPVANTGRNKVVDSVYNVQNKQFKFPDDENHEMKNTYLQVLKNGGFLWCQNQDNGRMTNIFQRNHHFCYYVGSTSRNIHGAAEFDRMHQFTENECSFKLDAKPQCNNQWVYIQENCEGIQYCVEVLQPASQIKVVYDDTGNHSYPAVSWRSSWHRGFQSRNVKSSALDHHTVLFIVLHDCIADFDATQGCSQCHSDYFEVEQIPGLLIQNEPVFKHNVSEQFCRPQPTLFEHQCETQENQEPTFCPKGFKKLTKTDGKKNEYTKLSDFASHNYWTCRTKVHGKQNITNENGDRQETDVDQGFMCSVNA